MPQDVRACFPAGFRQADQDMHAVCARAITQVNVDMHGTRLSLASALEGKEDVAERWNYLKNAAVKVLKGRRALEAAYEKGPSV